MVFHMNRKPFQFTERSKMVFFLYKCVKIVLNLIGKKYYSHFVINCAKMNQYIVQLFCYNVSFKQQMLSHEYTTDVYFRILNILRQMGLLAMNYLTIPKGTGCGVCKPWPRDPAAGGMLPFPGFPLLLPDCTSWKHMFDSF